VTDCLAHRIEDADQRLATAITNDDQRADMCRIVQAREMAKFARMDLERRRPALYGMKTGLAIDQQISVTVNRGAKKAVRASKPLRTPRARQMPVDITPHSRPGPSGSASDAQQNTLHDPNISAGTDGETP
jgi:hypothetical protein